MKVNVELWSPIKRSSRVIQMEGLFDVPLAERTGLSFSADLPVEDKDWHVSCILGRSGTGKSGLLRKLWPENSATFDWPEDACILDGFSPGHSTTDITETLVSCGFGSPPNWLRPYRALSTGEKFRADMARLILDGKDPIVVDEMTSTVDRTVAMACCMAVQKAVRRAGKRLVCASCHYDIADWLMPDWTFCTDNMTLERGRLWQPVKIDLEIIRADRRIWKWFRSFHYLSGDLNKSSRCFIGIYNDQAVAFCAALAHPHPTDRRRFREHRTVVLPQFQGIGIGGRISAAVAALHKADGCRYFSTTSHPGFNAHRRRHPELWRVARAAGFAKLIPSGFSKLAIRTEDRGMEWRANRSKITPRLTTTWEYVGPAWPDVAEARRMLYG